MKKSVRNTGLAMGAVMAIALPFTAREEGLRLEAYRDSVGIPTICFGETQGVQMGDVKTKEECQAIFYVRLGVFSKAVDMAIEPEMPPQVHAALTSFTYNVGIGAMKKSTLVKKANQGDFVGACNELLKWKNAGGKPILLSRRQRERQLCLSGL